MPVHKFQKVASLVSMGAGVISRGQDGLSTVLTIKWDRVGCWSQADCSIATLRICSESASTVVVRLLWRLSIITAIRGIMPNINERILQRSTIEAVDRAKKVTVGRFFQYSQDGGSVGLHGYATSVKRPENG